MKNIIIFIIISFIYPFYSFSQINEDSYLKKKSLKNYLDFLSIHSNYRQDKFGEIGFTDTNFINIKKGQTIIPDSIVSSFLIKNITKKKNNYQNYKGKIIKKTIYLIDIECVENSSFDYPNFIRLISVDTNSIKNNKKIKVGKVYRMKIFSFYRVDFFSSYEKDGVIVYPYRFKNAVYDNIFYGNLWIPEVDFRSYNWFKTNNLKGLYYFP